MEKYLSKAALAILLGVWISKAVLKSNLTPWAAIICIVAAGIIFLYAFFIHKGGKRHYFAFLILFFILGMVEFRLAYQHKSILDQVGGNTCTILCRVISDGKVKSDSTQYIVKTEGVSYKGTEHACSKKLILFTYSKQDYAYGDVLLATGRLEDFETGKNPGDFDFKLYYKSKGIERRMPADKVIFIRHGAAFDLGKFLHTAKDRIRLIIEQALPQKEGAILLGIMTGDTAEMDETAVEDYKKTGIAHILSVSGLHIGFLVVLIGYALKPLKIAPYLEALTTSGFVLLYIMMIGMPMPAVRAFIMLLVIQAGKLMAREYDLLASVSFAAILLLVLNPLAIGDPGFVISFACMFAIALLFEPVNRKLTMVPGILRENLALSLSVTLGIAPILVYYFNYLSILGILLNLVAVPVSFAITLAGFAGVIIGSISSYIGLYIFSVAYYLIRFLTFLTENLANLPYCGIILPRLPVYVLVPYGLAVLILTEGAGLQHYLYYKPAYKRAFLITALSAIFLFLLPAASTKIVFLDVGQGDSACILTPQKKVILVDGGGSAMAKRSFDIGRKVTVPALLHMGIWKIDTLAVSHIHEDHMQGLLAVLDTFPVNRILMPDSGFGSETLDHFLAKAAQKKIPVYYLKKGDKLILEKGLELKVLWPMELLVAGSSSDINNNSLVMRLDYGGFSVLLPGDIQSEAEEGLAGADLHCTVAKIAHHGSPYSTTQAYINAAAPRYGIISVGRNSFGHPSKETISRLEAFGTKVIRTDQSGAVIIKTDGKRMWIHTVK